MGIMKLTLITLCVLGLVCECMGRNDGAPVEACTTLAPFHYGISPQTSNPPFSVTAVGSDYTAGSKITVTLKALCGEKFKGFLLEARRADSTSNQDQPIGTFNIVSGSESVTGCGTGVQAVTHSSSVDKTEMTFEWTAPAGTGHIVFAASFVKEYRVFWTHVYSDVIRDASDNSQVNKGDKTYPSVSESCPGTTTQASTRTTVAAAYVPYDIGCGRIKGCFSDCNGERCNFLVSWIPGQDQIEFELAAVVKADNNKWLALGFSTDTEMGNDSVIECAKSDGGLNVYSSYNRPGGYKGNDRLNDPSVGVTKQAGSVTNGVMRCTILRDVNVADNKVFNLNNSYYLLFAMGDTQGNSDEKRAHSFNPLPAVSPTTFDLMSVNTVLPSSGLTAKAHAWVVAASFGSVLALSLKQV